MDEGEGEIPEEEGGTEFDPEVPKTDESIDVEGVSVLPEEEVAAKPEKDLEPIEEPTQEQATGEDVDVPELIEEEPIVVKKKKKSKPKKQEVEFNPEDEGEGDEVVASPAPKGKKGKKQKVSLVVEEISGERTETDLVEEPKKSKKGGGKGKKGKGKKSAEDEDGFKVKKKDLESKSSLMIPQMSIQEFLHRYASSLMDDDEWTWESYTPSDESLKKEEVKVSAKGKKGKKDKKGKGAKEKAPKAETPAVEEGGEEAPKKGGKKGKKGKKDKKAKAAVEETPAEAVQVVDIMAEIRKMKEQAEAEAAGLTEEPEASVAPSKKSGKSKKSKATTEGGEPKPKGPKGPKVKLSKKERAKLAAEMAEQARIQAELDAIRAEEEERLRQIEERKAAIEKEKQELSEQQLRTEQLHNSLQVISYFNNQYMDKALKDKAQREWEQYLNCDRLPDPYVCGQLNTYLHLWDRVIDTTSIADTIPKTAEVLHLLDVLTTLMEDPIGVEESLIDNWNWVYRVFCEYQQRSLDTATYRVLRDVHKKLNRLDLRRADYHMQDRNFKMGIWLLVMLPRSMPNPRRPPPPRIHIEFPEMSMSILFPHDIQCNYMAIRAMYLKYDHLSNLSASYEKPLVPTQYQSDLYQTTLEEWNSKLFYKYENRSQEVAEGEPQPPIDEFVDRAAGIIPIVPYRKLDPTASTYVIAEEDKLYMEIRESLVTQVEDNVINLRKFVVLGGVYSMDLFYQPPQPVIMVTFDMSVTRLEVPKCLHEVPFYIKYDTPPPIDPAARRDPEEIEEDMKKQEEELEKLLLVTLTVPDHIMWMDIPFVCQWNREKQVWTTEDVHDFKHIEDQGCITFRTGKFGCFAFVTNRYLNLPYQAWELKPELDGTITLQITAAILLIEFNVKDDRICVLQFQNTPNNALQDVVGVYHKLPKLMRILQKGGIDVFPAFDAFCYIEGTCEKHWPMTRHTYYNMAQLSVCYNFAWSRWNMTAGRRNLVMQMREYKPEKAKQVPHSMLLVTPLKAVLINCTEVSQMFSDETVEGMHFYADLYNLMKGISRMATRTKVQNAPAQLVATVSQLLIATRVMSFS